MTQASENIVESFFHAMETSKHSNTPYDNWVLSGCLPEDSLDDILNLPFPAPDLGGISGKRELHNKTRRYFDTENQEKHPSVKAFSEAFQDPRVTKRIEEFFKTDLSGTYLRIEYAQDTGGFWLEPHSDLGVKLFTMLLYLTPDESHKDLGTDIYDTDKKHVGRSPFESNGAFVFVPSDISFHGFESRTIEGVRKSLIINYVTDDWRAREQLAFPENPIS